MSDALQVFNFTIPAGSGSTATTTMGTPLGPCLVQRILITYPYGCAGLVGIQIYAGGGWAFPNQKNTYLAFDDYIYDFIVDNQVDTGGWSITGFNKDLLPHTIQIIYEYNYLRSSSSSIDLNPISL